MYKYDLTLNNIQCLIYHNVKTNQTSSRNNLNCVQKMIHIK